MGTKGLALSPKRLRGCQHLARGTVPPRAASPFQAATHSPQPITLTRNAPPCMARFPLGCGHGGGTQVKNNSKKSERLPPVLIVFQANKMV